MMVHDLYTRLTRGESIKVRTLPGGPSPGGKVFTIHPAYWGTMVLGFKLEVDGKVVREHRNEVLGRTKMDTWALLLEEIPEIPAPADQHDA